MKRILILGGGVGGTLTANLLVKKLRSRIGTGEVEIMVVDATGQRLRIVHGGRCNDGRLNGIVHDEPDVRRLGA